MTNYQYFVQRIDREPDTGKLITSLDRLYNAGIFSVSEFKRLDLKIVDKIIRRELP